MKTLCVTIVAVSLAAVLGSHSAAQQRSRQEEQRDAQRTSGRPNIDRELAICLAIDAQPVIHVAQLAETRAQRAEVKQFAEMLREEHKECLMRLKEIEPSVASLVTDRPRTAENRDTDVAAPRQLEAQDQAREARPEVQRPPARTTSGTDLRGTTQHGTDPRNAQLLDIKREIAEANINSLGQELGAKPKADFDRCFVGYQVGAHMQMLDTLKVFERHASPQLAAAIKDASMKTHEHLQQAKRLLETLESTPTRTSAEVRASEPAAN
jgi:predicted outer membrane protein